MAGLEEKRVVVAKKSEEASVFNARENFEPPKTLVEPALVTGNVGDRAITKKESGKIAEFYDRHKADLKNFSKISNSKVQEIKNELGEILNISTSNVVMYVRYPSNEITNIAIHDRRGTDSDGNPLMSKNPKAFISISE